MDGLEIPPIDQGNDKQEPMETTNSQSSYSGSRSVSVESTGGDHEKETTVLCITHEPLGTSDTEDPSIEGEQNKVSSGVTQLVFAILHEY